MNKYSRYKPVGWRGEPHRHYLAAKGIKTKQYFSKDPIVPGLFAKMFSLAASGDVEKSAKKGMNQQLYAKKKSKYEIGDIVTFGTEQYEIIDFDENAGYYTLITDEGKTEYAREEQLGLSMFANKYFVRNELKGNRESSALHRAYAKGWTKEELRENADIRKKFGISLQELEPKSRQRFPESTSRAEEGVTLQTDFDTLTPIQSTEIPTTAPEPIQEPAEPMMAQEPQEMMTQELEPVSEEPQFDEGEVMANGNERNATQVSTPGIPERSSLGAQL